MADRAAVPSLLHARAWALPPTLALLAAGLAGAADVPPAPAPEPAPAEAPVGTIVVTADRHPEPIANATATVDVVDRREVAERGGAIDGIDALQYTPGVEVENQFGGLDGGIAGLRLRGSAADSDTQVLVDGVPWNESASVTSDPNLSLLLVPGLERIEVVQGAQSGLYGSRAIGGVVDLQGPRPTVNPHGRGALGYGSFGTASGDGVVTGPILAGAPDAEAPLLGYALAAGGLDSAGYSALSDSPDHKPHKLEADGVRRGAASGRVEWHPAARTALYVSGNYADAWQAYDDFADPAAGDWRRQHQWRLGAGGDVGLPRDADLAGDAAFTRNRRQEHPAFGGDASYDSSEQYYSLRVGRTVAVAKNATVHLTLGGDHDAQSAATTSLDHRSQFRNGVWAEAQTRVADAVSADLSGRHDLTSNKGSADTWRTGLAWTPWAERLRLHAAAGTAFRAPSLDEQFGVYNFGFGSFVGNPNLSPQTSRSWEAGAAVRPDTGIDIGSTYFATLYRRRIVSIYDPTFTDGTLTNAPSSSSVHGIESEASWDDPAQPFALRLAHTWQMTHDDSGRPFTLIPQEHLSGAATVRGKLLGEQVWLTVGGTAVSARRASLGDRMPGFATAFAAAGWTFARGWEASVRADNLFDTGHSTDQYQAADPTGANRVYSYTGEPRAFFGTVSAEF
jgi:vitamin B12 transporter